MTVFLNGNNIIGISYSGGTDYEKNKLQKFKGYRDIGNWNVTEFAFRHECSG